MNSWLWPKETALENLLGLGDQGSSQLVFKLLGQGQCRAKSYESFVSFV
jgi:hypothetical protein